MKKLACIIYQTLLVCISFNCLNKKNIKIPIWWMSNWLNWRLNMLLKKNKQQLWNLKLHLISEVDTLSPILPLYAKQCLRNWFVQKSLTPLIFIYLCFNQSHVLGRGLPKVVQMLLVKRQKSPVEFDVYYKLLKNSLKLSISFNTRQNPSYIYIHTHTTHTYI